MASMVTSRASLGSSSFEFSSIKRVSSAWSSEPQLTPMRTGLSFSMATSIMVRKLSSSFLPIETVARIDAVLGQRSRALGILLQQNVTVVVEVADDGHGNAEPVEAVDDERHSLGGLVIVDGDAHQL